MSMPFSYLFLLFLQGQTKTIGCVTGFERGALLAKTDIESAFRLLPVHLDSLHLLGCFWEGGYFVDRCLPMGCSLLCAYFEAFSSFLEWVVRDVSDGASVINYLNVFYALVQDRTGYVLYCYT